MACSHLTAKDRFYLTAWCCTSSCTPTSVHAAEISHTLCRAL